ncbi:MAG: hypothetical protein CVT92_14815 [Bacteroidetes bacterium HGW-Bacteroidetes-1]|jgi:hypothetical protein|nr:MAG: hypothetical protein CVT92_14815 [Bacteroidetes bacterium HGW-Bacteroidetes-1]
MKKIFLLTVFMLVAIISCNTPSRLIKNERYDEAIEKTAAKLRSGKVKSDNIQALKTAYHAANQIDHDRIGFLRASGDPEIWPEVFERYQAMNWRQAKVKSLSNEIKDAIGFVPLDLNTEITEAKGRAQQYLFASAEKLLRSGSKMDARMAYQNLEELKQINPVYPSIDQLMRQALLQGTNQVLILFDNQTGVMLPMNFEQELLNFSMKEFNEGYVSYDLVEQKGTEYDYLIYVSLKQINVSPEKVESRRFTEQKKIADGKQPKRDGNGGIMLDSTGKIIEEIRYIIAEAFVNENLLTKSIRLVGSVDFVDNTSERTIHTTPIEGTSNFAYSFAIVNGDLRACTPPTLELMRRGPAPFPPDGGMIMDAVKQLNQITGNIIRRENNLMKHAD